MIDFSINSGAPTVKDDIEVILQQIDILFDTHKNDVYGKENFGVDYERYLYDLRMSASELESIIRSNLSEINSLGYTLDVSVYLMNGSEKEIAVIDITISKDGVTYNKTYKIQ